MRIAFLGNIANVAIEPLRALRKAHLRPKLFALAGEYKFSKEALNLVGQQNLDVELASLDGLHNSPKIWLFAKLRMEWLQIRSAFEVLTSGGVCSFNAALVYNKYLYLALVIVKLKPYLAFATGSDLREVAQLDQGSLGYRFRKYFFAAKVTFVLNTDLILVANQMRLPRSRFFPFIINTADYCPAKGKRRPGALRILMMSNLDWGVNDPTTNRMSLKGNDKFLLALGSFLKDFEAEVVIFFRGPDRDEAKRIVSYLGLDKFVRFIDPQDSARDRIKWLQWADVVADQFVIGSFGLGALEAMSTANVLLTFLNEDVARIAYEDDQPPFLNCQSEQDILSALQRCTSSEFVTELGQKASDWIARNHSAEFGTNLIKRELVKL